MKKENYLNLKGKLEAIVEESPAYNILAFVGFGVQMVEGNLFVGYEDQYEQLASLEVKGDCSYAELLEYTQKAIDNLEAEIPESYNRDSPEEFDRYVNQFGSLRAYVSLKDKLMNIPERIIETLLGGEPRD